MEFVGVGLECVASEIAQVTRYRHVEARRGIEAGAYGRASQGVRVMRPVTGSRVIDMEKTEREEAPEVPEDSALPQETDDVDQSDMEPTEP
jgi:hypothetical protein